MCKRERKKECESVCNRERESVGVCVWVGGGNGMKVWYRKRRRGEICIACLSLNIARIGFLFVAKKKETIERVLTGTRERARRDI